MTPCWMSHRGRMGISSLLAHNGVCSGLPETPISFKDWCICLELVVGLARGSGVGTRHHLANKGMSTCSGWVNLRVQVSLGTIVHWCSGFGLGTSFFTNQQVLCGLRSLALQPRWRDGLVMALLGAPLKGAPGTTDLNRKLCTADVTGNLPGCFSTYLVMHEDS